MAPIYANDLHSIIKSVQIELTSELSSSSSCPLELAMTLRIPRAINRIELTILGFCRVQLSIVDVNG